MENKLSEFFKGKKILITGHTGFKGSWLTQILLNFGADVVGYSLKPNTSPNLFKILKLDKKIKNYYADIRDFDKIKSIMEKEKPEIVFHLAAQPLVRDSYDDPLYTYETNIIGTANILQAVKDVGGVKAAIMITTDKVYENKEWIWAYRENDELGGYDPYSTSKACAELIIRSYIRSFFNVKDYGKKHNTLIASVRAGNVVGGGDWSKDRLVPDIIRAIFEGDGTVVLRNPESIRPWQHVLEPLLGYLLLAERLYNGEIDFIGAWNLAPNEENFITVEELVKKGTEILGKGRYIIKKDEEKHESKILKLDATKAKVYLGWRPLLSIDETLKWTFEWYRRYYNGEDMITFTNRQINTFFERWERARRH
ncbi:CDP-glucose 4,6-dehydratase [Methanocaldococcus villosus KIN24-T80]|uniref:CDP-glucose 4,6-dehydratase n=1 Tax=Methanocaldococcus villosus KIN24-T80 TaxID=1069083 RepID=N6VXE1_9EURY|nr:CDP-glucose 4,6-dehydratase [Methanocaldococcus villosus]ENN95792.1 CDP-glucose 4,6-dehydratase [Methanocaldococcus villosus KIN24-T80]